MNCLLFDTKNNLLSVYYNYKNKNEIIMLTALIFL